MRIEDCKEGQEGIIKTSCNTKHCHSVFTQTGKDTCVGLKCRVAFGAESKYVVIRGIDNGRCFRVVELVPNNIFETEE